MLQNYGRTHRQNYKYRLEKGRFTSVQILSLDITDANTAIKLCKFRTPTHSFSILDVVLPPSRQEDGGYFINIHFLYHYRIRKLSGIHQLDLDEKETETKQKQR